MSQLLPLLRATCLYCHHLKLAPAEIHRFICKLRLIQYGLVAEVEELEKIHLSSKVQKVNGVIHASAVGSEEENEESESEDEDALKRRREDFVRRAIKRNGGDTHRAAVAAEKDKAMSASRHATILEFLSAMTKPKACGNCKG